MADSTPTPTPAPSNLPRAAVPPSGTLSPAEVTDDRDNAPRLKDNLSGKRIRAIAAHPGQTTAVVVHKSDFARHNVEHNTIEFNFRKDNFTLPVGKNGVSEDAAEFLTSGFPMQFEYMGGNESEADE
jgi:hypothetical protein